MVKINHNYSSPLILNLKRDAPHGCVVISLLYSLRIIITFANDIAVIVLISHNHATAYREEVRGHSGARKTTSPLMFGKMFGLGTAPNSEEGHTNGQGIIKDDFLLRRLC